MVDSSCKSHKMCLLSISAYENNESVYYGKGDTGNKGSSILVVLALCCHTGSTGNIGSMGSTGNIGSMGSTGNIGSMGSTGSKGSMGSTRAGSTGSMG